MMKLLDKIIKTIPEISIWLMGNKSKSYFLQLVKMLILKATNKNNYSDAYGDLIENQELMEHVLFSIRCLNRELKKEMSLARKRDMEIRAKYGQNIQAIIVIVAIIIMTIFILFNVVYKQISPKQLHILSTLSIIVFSCLKDIVAFEFGSTDDHNKIIEKILFNKLAEMKNKNAMETTNNQYKKNLIKEDKDKDFLEELIL